MVPKIENAKTETTRRQSPAAFNCDLDLESAWLKHKFCIQSQTEVNI